MENLPQLSGAARDQAAKAVGVSGKSIDDAGDGSGNGTANQAAARSAIGVGAERRLSHPRLKNGQRPN